MRVIKLLSAVLLCFAMCTVGAAADTDANAATDRACLKKVVPINKEDTLKEEIPLTEEQKKYGLLGNTSNRLEHGAIMKKLDICVNQNKSLDDLEAVYDATPYMLRCFAKEFPDFFAYASSFPKTLSNVIDGFSTKYNVQKIDNEHIVIIYNVKDEYFLYIVFERNNRSSYDEWLVCGEHYYVSKGLKSDDFSPLQIGDGIEKLINIDPAAKYDEKSKIIRLLNPVVDENNKPISYTGTQRRYYRLLEDGLLEIYTESYKTDNADGTTSYSEYVITAMEFHPYGEIYSNDRTEIFNILRAEKPIELPRG